MAGEPENKNFSHQQKNIALILSGLLVILLLGIVLKMHSNTGSEDLTWKNQYEQLHNKYLLDIERGEREIAVLQQRLESGEIRDKEERERELAALKDRELEMQNTVEHYRATIDEMKEHFKEKRKKWEKTMAPKEVAEIVPPETSNAPVRLYRVERGDTLIRISNKLYGNSGRWKEIYDLNKDRLPGADSIREGTHLIVPEK